MSQQTNDIDPEVSGGRVVLDTRELSRLQLRVDGHPLGRMGRREEIADAVVWLCSPRSSFVTGQAIAVDGGGSWRDDRYGEAEGKHDV